MTFRTTAFSILFAGAAVLVTPALAVTVTNNHSETHEVTFDTGPAEDKQEVAPGASVTGECPEGCGVRIGGHDRMAKDGDKLAINEDGDLVSAGSADEG
jgi:hypothetical protein